MPKPGFWDLYKHAGFQEQEEGNTYPSTAHSPANQAHATGPMWRELPWKNHLNLDKQNTHR